MALRERGTPMPVKYWSRAGLMLTDWCNAACACCYANCSPANQQWMTAEQAITIWQSLVSASPHGCRLHLTGGEVFGRFELLLEVCRRAQQLGLGPLEAVETNGFWAQTEAVVRERLTALLQAGMESLTISADPYHQQFVPLERPRLLARIAEELLGAERVKVRWADWLANGCDTSLLDEVRRRQFFWEYAAAGRDRLTGRAGSGLNGLISLKLTENLVDISCRERLLRGRHVHIAPSGEVWPATCIGIVVGNALVQPIAEIWGNLEAEWAEMPIIGSLCLHGLGELLASAGQCGFLPCPSGYGTHCQLCYALREHMHRLGKAGPWLGPASVYAAGDATDADPGRKDVSGTMSSGMA